MWNGFCGDLIRRSNKFLLIMSSILFAGIVIFYGFNIHYFTGFFLGGHAATAAELIHAKSADDFTNPFVAIQGGETIPTDLQEVTTDDSHPNGYITARTIVTKIGDHELFVRVSPSHSLFFANPGGGDNAQPSLSVTGTLKPLSTSKQEFASRAQAMGSPVFLPYYLDSYEYKEFGWWSVVITGALAICCAWMFWLYLQRSADFTRHPFAKQIAHCGELAMLTQQIDSECAGAHFTVTNRAVTVHITQHWYIMTNAMAGSISRLDNLQWVYRTIIKRKMYYVITVGKNYQLNTFDKFGTKILAQLNEAKTGEAMSQLRSVAPQALYGYDKRVLKLWASYKKRDKSTFAAEAKQLVGGQPLPEVVTQNKYSR
jgi:hypothetical protein